MNINHITLVCKDLEKTGRLFQKIFGAILQHETSKEKFLQIGELWLVILIGEPIAKTYNHIAFTVDGSEFPRIKKELKELGLEILEGRKRKKCEGESIYFYDYDNHLFELHAGDLAERLKHKSAKA